MNDSSGEQQFVRTSHLFLALLFWLQRNIPASRDEAFVSFDRRTLVFRSKKKSLEKGLVVIMRCLALIVVPLLLPYAAGFWVAPPLSQHYHGLVTVARLARDDNNNNNNNNSSSKQPQQRRGYRFGDLTRRFVGDRVNQLTGKEEYEFGDLSRFVDSRIKHRVVPPASGRR